VTAEDIGDRLFILSGRQTPLCIARGGRDGPEVMKETIEAVRRVIKENRIDVVILDPFVALHAVPENDNGAINAVCRTLAMLADETGCSIEIVHHVRKSAPGQGEHTVEDARGAGAMLAAVRSARVLNGMTREEAARAGIENARLYFRVDNGKSNLAPPAEHSTWHHLVSVQLGNGRPGTAGDDVGVVAPWAWPDPSDSLSPDDIRAIQDAVAGGEWRDDVRSNVWAGYAVADALGWDRDTPAAKTKLKAVLQSLKEDGFLRTKSGLDAARKRKVFVVVGKQLEQNQ
jgi:hypothetical protein